MAILRAEAWDYVDKFIQNLDGKMLNSSVPSTKALPTENIR